MKYDHLTHKRVHIFSHFLCPCDDLLNVKIKSFKKDTNFKDMILRSTDL